MRHEFPKGDEVLELRTGLSQALYRGLLTCSQKIMSPMSPEYFTHEPSTCVHAQRGACTHVHAYTHMHTHTCTRA